MAIKNIASRIQHRIDTATNWTTEDPVLLSGELGVESDTNLIKVGDGKTKWSELTYINNSGVVNNSMSVDNNTDVEYLQSVGTPMIIDTTGDSSAGT